MRQHRSQIQLQLAHIEFRWVVRPFAVGKKRLCISTQGLQKPGNFSVVPRDEDLRSWREAPDLVSQIQELFVLKSAVDGKTEFFGGRLDRKSRTLAMARVPRREDVVQLKLLPVDREILEIICVALSACG